ncbi:hypothetical protein V6N13_124883 [Hibiscus sabdariffa]
MFFRAKKIKLGGNSADKTMKQAILLLIICFGVFFCTIAEDPYRFYTWEVTYGTRAPLGVPQQLKDQIGSYMYYPSTLLHRASGGFGAINIIQRSVISIPYPEPDGDITLLIGDWYTNGYKALQEKLDSGLDLPLPDGLLINGANKTYTFTGQKGKTYKLRVTNVVKDYFIVASTRFTKPILTTTGILRYIGSNTPASLPLPVGPTYHIHWSMKQARTISLNAIKDSPPSLPPVLGVSVFGLTLHDFVEIVFQNTESVTQSWHLDGSSFYVAGYGGGNWTIASRKRYNLADAISRHTVQVYPLGWTAILVSLDNKGMWNLRSQNWSKRYLGQQVYLRVWNDEKSLFTEADIPTNALRCGKALQF